MVMSIMLVINVVNVVMVLVMHTTYIYNLDQELMEAESPGLVFSPFAEKVLSVPQDSRIAFRTLSFSLGTVREDGSV
jgi:hypothetical protein